jgi:hypothetical protein
MEPPRYMLSVRVALILRREQHACRTHLPGPLAAFKHIYCYKRACVSDIIIPTCPFLTRTMQQSHCSSLQAWLRILEHAA